MRIFVDRDHQLSTLEPMILDEEHQQRLVALCANDGMGKTALLDQIYDRHRGRTAIASVDVGRVYDSLSLLNRIADQFAAQQVDVSAYRAMATRLAAPPSLKAELKNIEAHNSPIDITLTACAEQRYLADILLSQLLTDIESAPRPPRHLILMDRYEQAAEPLREWLDTTFIARILQRNATVCVLAGCNEPPLAHTEQQYAVHMSLPLLGVEEISQWLAAAGVPQTREYVTFLWQGTKGIPADLNLFIINLVAAGKSSANG